MNSAKLFYKAYSDPDPKWQALVARAVIPIALGWLLAYGALALYRWVRRGFEAKAVQSAP